MNRTIKVLMTWAITGGLAVGAGATAVEFAAADGGSLDRALTQDEVRQQLAHAAPAAPAKEAPTTTAGEPAVVVAKYGSLEFSCNGTSVALINVTRKPGFTIAYEVSGSPQRETVIFTDLNETRSVISAQCVTGEPKWEVIEK